MDHTQPLLLARDLRVVFRGRGDPVVAVDGISLELERGRTLAVVGESGCGKSTLARALLRLVPLAAGSVVLDGTDITAMTQSQLRPLRRHMQLVFQDPGGSLNEFMTVGSIVGEPLLVHGMASGSTLGDRVATLLGQVGLSPDDARRHPHAFSGGQKQRIALARAIATSPSLLVCDEPTSALDVSVQASILNLLADLQDELDLAILFISHDLAVVHQFCDEAMVMDDGRVIELGEVGAIVHEPTHLRTRLLVEAALGVRQLALK